MNWLLLLLVFLSSSVNGSNYPDQSKGKECSQHFVAENDKIILTRKSEENGAQFLKTFSSSSVDECHRLCCKNEQCSVAVYENKGQHLCYLFNCLRPNVCSFMKHANYVTLRKDITLKANKTRKAPPKKRTVALGDRCDADAQCSDPKSACSQGRCACSEGSIQKNAKCVKSVCPKPDFQFQCEDLSKSPRCIAIYDTCNGIAQCGDGSDERNCVANPSKTETGDDISSSELGPSHPDGREAAASHRHNLPDKPPPPPPAETGHKKDKGKAKSGGDGGHKPKAGGKPHTGKAPVTIFANATTAQHPAKSSKPADNSAPQRTQITSEYVAMLQKSYQQSKIAVVVLGLTLAVTGMALSFFVCRIRRIKNRLRRGKALTSDEADYLINGMYL